MFKVRLRTFYAIKKKKEDLKKKNTLEPCHVRVRTTNNYNVTKHLVQ